LLDALCDVFNVGPRELLEREPKRRNEEPSKKKGLTEQMPFPILPHHLMSKSTKRSYPMPESHARVYYEPDEVVVQLAAMGLSVPVLLEAVTAGEVARLGCTANTPYCFPGIAAWAYTVTALRDLLVPLGWEKSDAGNYPLIVHPTRTFSIGVATGNEDTANRYITPKTKFPKGPATIERVEMNGMTLFGEPVLLKRIEPAPDHSTWLLLIARNIDGVRSELSLPNSIGEDGRVDGWNERIVLPTIDPNGGRGLSAPLPEPGPDFDIDVVRRVS
jgi:hypothetical protein